MESVRMFPQMRGEKPLLKPLTYLKCPECGTTNSRPFKEGDYVFKEVEEKCPKCGCAKMKIIGIYVKEKPKKPASKSKAF